MMWYLGSMDLIVYGLAIEFLVVLDLGCWFVAGVGLFPSIDNYMV
jgi:hypothetical protein